jgi:hypothetical protein
MVSPLDWDREKKEKTCTALSFLDASITVITGLAERHRPASLPKAILTGGTF